MIFRDEVSRRNFLLENPHASFKELQSKFKLSYSGVREFLSRNSITSDIIPGYTVIDISERLGFRNSDIIRRAIRSKSLKAKYVRGKFYLLLLDVQKWVQEFKTFETLKCFFCSVKVQGDIYCSQHGGSSTLLNSKSHILKLTPDWEKSVLDIRNLVKILRMKRGITKSTYSYPNVFWREIEEFLYKEIKILSLSTLDSILTALKLKGILRYNSHFLSIKPDYRDKTSAFLKRVYPECDLRRLESNYNFNYSTLHQYFNGYGANPTFRVIHRIFYLERDGLEIQFDEI